MEGLKAGNYTFKVQRRGRIVTNSGENLRIKKGVIVLRSYWLYQDFNYFMLVFLTLTWIGPITGEAYVILRWLRLRRKAESKDIAS